MTCAFTCCKSSDLPLLRDVYFDDLKITHTRWGYQGQYAEKDTITGLNEFQLRMYDARFGRWLSADPYGQYHSPYMAMGNVPQMSVDPDGGWSWAAAGVGFAAGAGIGYAITGDWEGALLGGLAGGAIGGASFRADTKSVSAGSQTGGHTILQKTIVPTKFGYASGNLLASAGRSYLSAQQEDEADQINIARFIPEMFQFERIGESDWQAAGITHTTIGFVAGFKPVGVIFQLEVGAPIKNRYQQYYHPRLLSNLAAEAANEASEKIVKNKRLFYNPMSNAIIPPMFARDMQTILNRKLRNHGLVGGGARVNTPIISNLDNIIDFLDYMK